MCLPGLQIRNCSVSQTLTSIILFGDVTRLCISDTPITASLVDFVTQRVSRDARITYGDVSLHWSTEEVLGTEKQGKAL